MTYRELKGEAIIATLQALSARIADRFPAAGLRGVAAELLSVATEDASRAEKLRRPHVLIRTGLACVLLIGVAGLLLVAKPMGGIVQQYGWSALIGQARGLDLFQGLEAVLNIVLLVGAALWFLLNLETRIKREICLHDLHVLRSIAHVIDMHQLTKDPTVLLADQATPASPRRSLTPFELARYLDYCAEMLAITGKVAAIYLQASRDPVVLDAVNDIESLTTNLSRKIWQKIAMLGIPIAPNA